MCLLATWRMELMDLLIIEVMYGCISGPAKLIGISHHTWGVVWLHLNCTSSRSPAAPSCQILPWRHPVSCDYSTMPYICLIMEQVIIWTLCLAALCVMLWLTVVIEVVEQKGCFRLNILGEKLLHLLILTQWYLERSTINDRCSGVSCSGCQRNIMLIVWTVLKRLIGTNFICMLSLFRTLTFSCFLGLLEIIWALGLRLLQVVWRHWDLLLIFTRVSIVFHTLYRV